LDPDSFGSRGIKGREKQSFTNKHLCFFSQEITFFRAFFLALDPDSSNFVDPDPYTINPQSTKLVCIECKKVNSDYLDDTYFLFVCNNFVSNS